MENKIFIDFLKQKEWNISQLSVNKEIDFNKLANGRLLKVPEDIKNFVQSFEVLANKEDNIWFLSLKDYESNPDAAFPWNEFEKQSLDSVDDDRQNDVVEFWSSHLPIIMTVKNGYQYVAVGIGENNKGEIFYGSEPEYEEAVLIAKSFLEFKEKYLEALNGNPFSDYYKFLI